MGKMMSPLFLGCFDQILFIFAGNGIGPDGIKTLVSMATESSHRVIMVKTVSPFFVRCFSSDPFHTCR